MVSVVIPCYNQGAFLEEALESVYAQTYASWECIIVNDGSTDETAAVATIWTEKDARFSYIKQENQGVVMARNNGISQAKGLLILPLDADDKISEEYMALAVLQFQNNPDLSLVYCRASYFGTKDGEWDLPPFSREELARRNIIFNCAFFKKEAFNAIGGYDVNVSNGLEDWEFWIHLLKQGGEVYKIEKVCFFYRQLENSRNQSIHEQQYQEIYNYLSVKHADFFVQQLGSFKELAEDNKSLRKQNKKLHAALAKEKRKLNIRAILRNFKRKLF